MNEMFNNVSSEESSGAGGELKAKLDFRVLVLYLRSRWFLFVGLFILTLFFSFLLLEIGMRHSLKSWTAEAKLFHQTRSEKVPSFYKQLDTKAIAELVGTHSTMRRAAQKLTFGKTRKNLFKYLEITTNKAKPNIVVVSASYRDPDTAAAVANAIAEAGVEEYIELQNGTLKSMLSERRRRKSQLMGELESLEREAAACISRKNAFNPEEELEHLRRLMSDRLFKLGDAQTRFRELSSRVVELDVQLRKIDKEVRYMHKTHGSEMAELDKLRKELSKMEQIYTAKNPRISQLRSELATRETLLKKTEQSPDEIIFTINQVFLSLQEELIKSKIELNSNGQTIKELNQQIETTRKEGLENQERLGVFRELQRRIASTQDGMKLLDTGINELELLLNSTIPDFSVLELAAPPQYRSRKAVYAFSFLIALLATGGYGGGVVLFSLMFGNVKSSKELMLLTGFDNLGAIPDPEDPKIHSGAELSAMLGSFNVLQRMLAGGKRLFFFEPDVEEQDQRLLNCWIEHFGVNGMRTFRLKCVPLAMREKYMPDASRSDRKTELDDELICVEKQFNRGFFFHQDELFMVPAESELLKSDLELLAQNYDLIIIEKVGSAFSEAFFRQLCEFSDYCVVCARFDHTPKQELKHLALAVKREAQTRETRAGGILTGVREPFWKGEKC